jgi:hypothetical protein
MRDFKAEYYTKDDFRKLRNKFKSTMEIAIRDKDIVDQSGNW